MENKYYIPSIEEFYVGFEYTLVDSTNKAIKKTTTYVDLVLDSWIDKWHNNNLIQVKYLDKEDIESLGFKLIGEQKIDNSKKEYSLKINNMREIEMVTYSILIIKIIEKGYFRADDTTLFEGKIKNINELKRILTMIGVI